MSSNKAAEIFEHVKALNVEYLEVDAEKVVPEASFADDFKVDSLDYVELIMAIEEKFDISVPDEDAEKITTVQSLVDYISEKIGA